MSFDQESEHPHSEGDWLEQRHGVRSRAQSPIGSSPLENDAEPVLTLASSVDDQHPKVPLNSLAIVLGHTYRDRRRSRARRLRRLQRRSRRTDTSSVPGALLTQGATQQSSSRASDSPVSLAYQDGVSSLNEAATSRVETCQPDHPDQNDADARLELLLLSTAEQAPPSSGHLVTAAYPVDREVVADQSDSQSGSRRIKTLGVWDSLTAAKGAVEQFSQLPRFRDYEIVIKTRLLSDADDGKHSDSSVYANAQDLGEIGFSKMVVIEIEEYNARLGV